MHLHYHRLHLTSRQHAARFPTLLGQTGLDHMQARTTCLFLQLPNGRLYQQLAAGEKGRRTNERNTDNGSRLTMVSFS